MRSFKVKQAIGEKAFYYIQVCYLGFGWSRVCEHHYGFCGSISVIKCFKSPKQARDYIKKQYGESARIKTTW